MRTISTGLAALLSTLAALGSLAGCSKSDADPAAAQRRPAVPVHAATAVEKDVPIQLRAIGTVEAYRQRRRQVAGRGQLAEVHFREGQEVHKGDLLFTIDPRPFEAALRQAEANLAAIAPRRSNADVEAQRLTQLLAQQIVSQRRVRSGADAGGVDARGRRGRRGRGRERASLQLQYCYIRSPIDGRIGQLLVNRRQRREGERDDAGGRSIRSARSTSRFSVPQQDLPEIRERTAAGGALRVDAVCRRDAGQRGQRRAELHRQHGRHDTGTVLLKALVRQRRRGAVAGTVRRRRC